MNTEKNFKIEYNGKTLDTLIALCPAGLAGIYFFGLRALVLIATCAAACILFEYLWNTFVLKSSGASLEAVAEGGPQGAHIPSVCSTVNYFTDKSFNIADLTQGFCKLSAANSVFIKLFNSCLSSAYLHRRKKGS